MSEVNQDEIKYNYVIYKIEFEIPVEELDEEDIDENDTIGDVKKFVYIGSSRRFEERVLQHLSACRNEHKQPLYKFINKYDLQFDKDSFEIIETHENITEKEARKIEERNRKEYVNILGGICVLNEIRAIRTIEERKEAERLYEIKRAQTIERIAYRIAYGLSEEGKTTIKAYNKYYEQTEKCKKYRKEYRKEYQKRPWTCPICKKTLQMGSKKNHLKNIHKQN